MTEIKLPRTNEHKTSKEAEGDFDKIFLDNEPESEVI